MMLIVACIIAVVGLAILSLLAWLLIQVQSQQQRMSTRIDELNGRLWARAATVSEPPVEQPREPAEPEPVDPYNALAGKPAPGFALDVLTGGRVTLASLLTPAKPLLVLFTDPRCGPCYELLPDLGGWQRVYGDRLSFALISTGEPKTNIAMTSEYGIRPVLLQQERETVEAYDLQQAPAAVVIQPDGRVSAGPRYGAHAIRKLVAETLGLMMPEAPSHETQVAGIGQVAPLLRRPDLDGQAVEIGGPSSEPTLLLFWSPGCSGCQKILPDIKAFETAVERLRVVLISRGPTGLNQEVGFRSPVVLDDDLSLAQSFGVTGTPAAVLLDGRGMVVTQVARGSDGVRGALQALATSFAPALATAQSIAETN
jgi:thiol-disulfide isomerase/thioredoxin